jgi:hypothetical protein
MNLIDPNNYYLAIAKELMNIIRDPWVKARVVTKRTEDYPIYYRQDGTCESDVYSAELAT